MNDQEPIKVIDITVPSSTDEAPYDVYIVLSDSPPSGWDEAFREVWTGPGMPIPARPVLVSGPYIILERTTLEDVRALDLYPRVRSAVRKTNDRYAKQQAEAARAAQERERRTTEEQARRERLLQEIRTDPTCPRHPT